MEKKKSDKKPVPRKRKTELWGKNLAGKKMPRKNIYTVTK
jgi:hypothetical protein